MAVDGDQGNIFTSTDPAGGATKWKRTSTGLNDGLLSVSCPTAKLCLVTQVDSGDLLVSIDPTAGARSWADVQLAGGPRQGLGDVVCAPEKTCVVGGEFVSTDPGAAARKAAKPQLSGSVRGVAGHRPRLALHVSAGIPPGRAVKTITVALPHGMTFSTQHLTSGIRVSERGDRRLAYRTTLRHNKLVIVLARSVSHAQITISASSLDASNGLARAVAQQKIKRLTFPVTAIDAGRATTKLPLTIRAS